MMRRKIAILGSTGSIGQSALNVIRNKLNDFEVTTLSASKNYKLLAAQANEFKPKFVALSDKKQEKKLNDLLNGSRVKIGAGPKAVIEAATYEGIDTVVAAISGSAGLLPTLEAIKTGTTIALANKETLVMGGNIVMNKAKESGAKIIPVDSEHSAVFQSLNAGKNSEVARIILTASGGPFYNYNKSSLNKITIKQALKHPVWKMGAKITIDSATMANKGLEVIEAYYLFNLPAEKIEVVIHPQSIVHSMVEYQDGSIIAQMSNPDMQIPIQYALTWPNRKNGHTEKFSFINAQNLQFLPRKDELFPALPLAYEALSIGPSGAIAYNAADEIAVKAFLSESLSFDKIPRVIEEVVEKVNLKSVTSIEDVLLINEQSVRLAEEKIKKLNE